MKVYDNLKDMLQHDGEAKKYYNSLPDYVRETISQRGDNVYSEDTLYTYAKNLLQGDD